MPYHRLAGLYSTYNPGTTYILHRLVTAAHDGQGAIFYNSATRMVAAGGCGASAGLLHPCHRKQIQWWNQMGKLGMPDRFHCRNPVLQPVGNSFRTFRRSFRRRVIRRKKRPRCLEIGHRGTDRFPGRNSIQSSDMRVFYMVLCQGVFYRCSVMLINPITTSLESVSRTR